MNPTQALAAARSLLFVPGNRPERFEKAGHSGADAIVIDLEDSVPPAHKAQARANLAEHGARLRALNVPLVVRINAAGSDAAADVAAVRECVGLAGIMVPKAEASSRLEALHEAFDGVPVLPLIETAAGLHAVHAIAASPGVLRLVVGTVDFMADMALSCDELESELVPLRFAVAMATRSAGLACAIDGVTVDIGDERRLRDDTLRALRFGFGAKLCIHPRQVAVVHRALAPSDRELDWARRVLAADAASGGAAVQLDGRMVDLPVVLQARRTIARAAEAGAST